MGEADAMGLAPWKGIGGPIQGEIGKPQFFEALDAEEDFPSRPFCDLRFSLRKG